MPTFHVQLHMSNSSNSDGTAPDLFQREQSSANSSKQAMVMFSDIPTSLVSPHYSIPNPSSPLPNIHQEKHKQQPIWMSPI